LGDCSSLTYPPKRMRKNVHRAVGFCCLSLLEGGYVSAADVKKSILNHVIVDPAHDERSDALARKDPAFADITTVAKAILDADFTALRKLRDDAESGRSTRRRPLDALGEDPREWKDNDGDKIVTVKDGRVTEVQLSNFSIVALPAAIGELNALGKFMVSQCYELAALPAAMGELGALTTLDLCDCYQLAALPAEIGKLKALTTLNLGGCERLDKLPDAIGGLGALTTLVLDGCSGLVVLPDAIGELKQLTSFALHKCSSLKKLPDAIGDLKALTTLELRACPSLAELPALIGGLGALTTLDLSDCAKLTTLPDAISELGALTKLVVSGCSSLVALPESMTGLGALKGLDLDGCTKMTFPPPHIHSDVDRIKRLLSNTTRVLTGGLLAADVDATAKADFIEGVIAHAPFRQTPRTGRQQQPGARRPHERQGRVRHRPRGFALPPRHAKGPFLPRPLRDRRRPGGAPVGDVARRARRRPRGGRRSWGTICRVR